ncbi:hypothetical protein F5Y16DRAFT_360229 [Xylariaceae sp. FL0255]|nr:hypothetical protein F5Y16DRAFT_360229 [Xylariaceae sp. FL0255]
MSEKINAAKHRRQRWRLAKSCEPCRARKVKCDRGLPCQTCLKSRASLSCTYKPEPDQALSKSPDRSPSPSLSRASAGHYHNEDAVKNLVQKISRLEHFTGQPETTGSGPNISGYALKSLEARVAKIEQRLASDSRNEIRSLDRSDLKIPLPRPHLRVEHEKTRLFGKTHWVHSLDQFTLLRQMQKTPYSIVDNTFPSHKVSMCEASQIRRRAKSLGPKLLQDPLPSFRRTIPTRNICDDALDAYLRTYEPMFRILHVPSFMRDYEGYWLNPESSSNEFILKLSMILTIGAIFFRNRSTANEIRGIAREWIYAVQWWLVGPDERDAMSLEGVQIFCLLLLARQASALGGTASIITEALPKLSFTIGLHVDPRFLPSMTPLESELRRRLWITVLELITITALNSTLPLLVSLDDSCVRLPSNVADSSFSTTLGEEPARQPSKHEDMDCSLQLLLAKSLRLRMQIVRELNDASCEASYQKVLETTSTLKTHCRDISAFFHTNTTGDRQNPMSSLSFHQKFIDCYLRRLILFLHRPFSNKSRRQHQFLLSRKDCLESCLVMASYTENGNIADGVIDEYTYSCMAGGGMFKGPLGQDVICAIAIEIVTQLEEESEHDAQKAHTKVLDPLAMLSRSNRRPLIDFLERTREQWKQIIALGCASLKQYLFLLGIEAHIQAMQSGGDFKNALKEIIITYLREILDFIRDSPVYQGSSDPESLMTDNSSSYDIDPMTFFGFIFNDFNNLEPDVAMDIPEWNDTTTSVRDFNF